MTQLHFVLLLVLLASCCQKYFSFKYAARGRAFNSDFSLQAKRRTKLGKKNNLEKTPQPKDSPDDTSVSSDLEAILRDNTRIAIPTKDAKLEEDEKVFMKKEKTEILNKGVYGELENDLRDFKRKQLVDYQSKLIKPEENKSDEDSIANKAKGLISTVLIADFFVVIIFLVWFLVAAALQKTYPVVLERFQDIFQPVVVPSLTVLMAGSIASGLLGDKEKD